MALRIITWNVNSIRQRLDHVARLVEARRPDVLCLQETKVTDALFPRDALAALGFEHQHIHGQPGYNGVALLSRRPLVERTTETWCGREDARHAVATFADGTEIHSLYVPKGGHTPDPQDAKFAYKLAFLGASLRSRAGRPRSRVSAALSSRCDRDCSARA